MRKVVTLSLTEIEQAFIERMKEQNGWLMSETIHRALDLFRAKQEPKMLLLQQEAVKLRKEIQARLSKGQKVTARQLKREDAGRIICQRLNGTIDGEGYCNFTDYYETPAEHLRKDKSRKVALVDLSEADIKRQFRDGTRESYEKYCKDRGLLPY